MYRRQESKQATFFIPGSLSDYVPEVHILRRMDAVLDLGWVEKELRGLYTERTGRPCINPKRVMPASRFSYDAKHDLLHCPEGKTLTPRSRARNGRFFRARAADCKVCPLWQRCVPPAAKVCSILITDGYCALLRTRRNRQKGWSEAYQEAYRRHRWKVEGAHGEAKCQHGLRQAVRRGLANVAMQLYMTAAVMNLKRLARAAAGLITRFLRDYRPHRRPSLAFTHFPYRPPLLAISKKASVPSPDS